MNTVFDYRRLHCLATEFAPRIVIICLLFHFLFAKFYRSLNALVAPQDVVYLSALFTSSVLFLGVGDRIRRKSFIGQMADSWLFAFFIASAISFFCSQNIFLKSDRYLWLVIGINWALVVREVAKASKDSSEFVSFLINGLIICLVIGGVLVIQDNQYHYKGVERWSGMWRNPNSYGVLMSVGMLLVLARLLGCIFRNTAKKYLFFLIIALCTFSYCLIKSLSRGAFVGAAIGMVYIIGNLKTCPSFLNNWNNDCCGITGLLKQFNYKKQKTIYIGLIAILVCICLTHIYYSGHTIYSRLMSVTDVYDLSLINRIDAWNSGCKIVGDNMFLGLGWEDLSEYYEAFYKNETMVDAGALITNDYLVIGGSSGLLALCMFLRFLYGLVKLPLFKINDSGAIYEDYTSLGIRAAVVSMSVGMVFSSGLFVVCTASVFWTLIGLGIYRKVATEHNAKRDVSFREGFKITANNSCFLKYELTERKNLDCLNRLRTVERVFLRKWLGVCVITMICFILSTIKDQKAFAIHRLKSDNRDYFFVKPFSNDKIPMVIYVVPKTVSEIELGSHLRELADCGMAAAGFRLSEDNAENDFEKFAKINTYFREREWVDEAKIGWVFDGVPAKCLGQAILAKGGAKPAVIVQKSGIDSDLKSNKQNVAFGNENLSEFEIQPLKTLKVWFIRGESDMVYHSSDAGRLEASFVSVGAITFRTFDVNSEGLRLDLSQSYSRCIANFLFQEFALDRAVYNASDENVSRSRITMFFGVFSVGVLFIGGLFLLSRGNVKASRFLRYFSRRSFLLMLSVCVVGLLVVGFQIQKHGFQKPLFGGRGGRGGFSLFSNSIQGQRSLAHGIDEMNVAGLERERVYKRLDNEYFRRYVLSRNVEDDRLEMYSRRTLWKYLVRCVKSETNPEIIVNIVNRALTDRVAVTDKKNELDEIWGFFDCGWANEKQYQRLFVSGLRSVGIVSRLQNGRCEYWNGQVWVVAPSPFMLIPNILHVQESE